MSTTRHVIASLVSAALIVPIPASSQQPAEGASLIGTAKDAAGQSITNITVQLRDLTTGQLVGKTTSSAAGSFEFTGLAAGTYSVEIVSAAGEIIGTSVAIEVAFGAAVSGVTVTAPGTTGGAAAAASAAGAAAGGGATGVTTAVIVTTAAAGAGIAAVVPVKPVASPTQ